MPVAKRRRDSGSAAVISAPESSDDELPHKYGNSGKAIANKVILRQKRALDDQENDGVVSDDDVVSDHLTQFRDLEDCDADSQIDTNTAESGIIKKIWLADFMNHENFHCEFNSSINFLSGNNGSGKSAILTALIIGLGGSPKSAGRGKLQELIRKGQSSATIRIELHNQGLDAFKIEEYGPIIVVERRILSSGSTTIKLKDYTNKPRSTAMKELRTMIDHFNIQVDNPIAVLNQDKSKTFFVSSDADKYRFFMEATQLDIIHKNYHKSQENIKMLEASIPDLVMAENLAEKNAIAAENIYKGMQKVKEKKGEVLRLKNEAMWVNIAEKELRRDKCAEQINGHEANATKLREKIASRIAKRDQHQAKAALLAEDQKVIEIETRKLDEGSEALKIARDKRKKAESKRKHWDKVRKQQGALLESAKEEINQQRTGIAAKARAFHEKHEATITNKESELAQLYNRRDGILSEAEEIKSQKSIDDEQDRQIQREFKELVAKRDQNKRDLARLSKSSGKRVDVFGSDAAILHNAIESQSWSSSPPIGPIGLYIKLNDQRWGMAVESALGSMFGTFIVGSSADERLLRDLAKKKGCRLVPHIIRMKSEKRFNIERSRARPSNQMFRSIEQLVTIECDEVFNAIVNQTSFHQVILIHTSQDPNGVMFPSGGGTQIKSAYDNEGVQYITHGSRVYRSQVHGQSSRLTADKTSEIARLNEAMKLLNNDLDRLTAELREAKIKLSETNKRLKILEEEKTSLELKARRLEREIDHARSQEAPEEPDFAENEEELARLQTELEDTERQYGDAVAQEKDARLAEKPLGDAADAKKHMVEELIQKLKDSTEELTNIEQHVDVLNQKIEGYEIELQKNVSAKAVAQTERDEWDLAATTNIEAAYELQASEPLPGRAADGKDRPPTDLRKRPADVLERKIAANEKAIQAQEADQGEYSVVEHEFFEQTKMWKQAQKNLKDSLSILDLLKTGQANRDGQMRDFRKIIGMRLGIMFRDLLSKRGYTGSLDIAHAEEVIRIRVDVTGRAIAETPVRKRSKAGANESLSGGEKSFSSACFIMALWDVMECPFRSLDEFDVFMDQANRQASVKMMIEIARLKKDKQFILLTPLSLTIFKDIDGDDIKVTRLKPPREATQAQITDY